MGFGPRFQAYKTDVTAWTSRRWFLLCQSSKYNMSWLLDALTQLSWFAISNITQRIEPDSHCTYYVTLRRVRTTDGVVGKQWVLHKLSVYIGSLCHPACKMRMRSVILSFATCPAVQYLSTLSPKDYIFKKNVTEHKMGVLIFAASLSEIFFIQRWIGLHVKYRCCCPN